MLMLLLDVFEYPCDIRGARSQLLLPMSPATFCSKGLNAPLLCASTEGMDVDITDLEDKDFTVILFLHSALRDADVTTDATSV